LWSAVLRHNLTERLCWKLEEEIYLPWRIMRFNSYLKRLTSLEASLCGRHDGIKTIDIFYRLLQIEDEGQPSIADSPI